ncbi:uncharacterized protein N7469_007674 [Penicillium citrinum]|uniref:Uncharacterized protein n=1 Tax=Penicillium citrinum TaxID=5077 RepID=A0A9W9NQJ8_PENCI|nr:uncharacterized protein N7469_007674 [Penicillium citrinum]KAJ5224171.1 hypothetical protein N7469_007674 [Penicillium citrinum]
MLGGGDWTNLDEQCHLLEITDTPEELDMRDMKNAMVKEVEHLEELCTSLEVRRQWLDDEAKELRLAQAFHQDELRRQQTLLEDAERATQTALVKNHALESKLAMLEPWSYSMSDDEATHAFECLHRDIKGWVDQHYNTSKIGTDCCLEVHTSETTSSNCSGSHQDFSFLLHSEILQNIQADIFEDIFCSILAPFTVGTSRSSWDHHFRVIDKEVQNICPMAVWQNWRSALSKATASLEKESLTAICNDIIQRNEVKFGQFSVMKSSERMKQLKKIVCDCFEFKQKLESQGKLYYFWWSPQGLALREERMVSNTGTYPVGATVRRTLWPMFYRQMPEEWVILTKEVVVMSIPKTLRQIESSSSIF